MRFQAASATRAVEHFERHAPLLTMLDVAPFELLGRDENKRTFAKRLTSLRGLRLAGLNRVCARASKLAGSGGLFTGFSKAHRWIATQSHFRWAPGPRKAEYPFLCTPWRNDQPKASAVAMTAGLGHRNGAGRKLVRLPGFWARDKFAGRHGLGLLEGFGQKPPGEATPGGFVFYSSRSEVL
jgi:hypothetical protein